MPRKRMIDPGFWRDEKIARCSYLERLLFIGLWSFAEDDGVGRASPLLIKADVFPYETLREADIKKSLEKLASLGLILLYEIDSQMYYYIVNFNKHQVINKPSRCYLPLPPDAPAQFTGAFMLPAEHDGDNDEPLPEDYGSTTAPVTPEDKRKEVKRNERKYIYSEIVSYLNEKAHTSYRSSSKATQRLIDARLNDNFTLEHFKRVIDIKCAEWGHAPQGGGTDMRKYLRPETLLGTKFESYLNQEPNFARKPQERKEGEIW